MFVLVGRVRKKIKKKIPDEVSEASGIQESSIGTFNFFFEGLTQELFYGICFNLYILTSEELDLITFNFHLSIVFSSSDSRNCDRNFSKRRFMYNSKNKNRFDKGNVKTEFFIKRGKDELLKDFDLDPQKYDFVSIKFTFANNYPRKENFILYYCDKTEVGNTHEDKKKFHEKRGYLPIYKKKLDISLEYLLGNYIKKLEIVTNGPEDVSYDEMNLKIRNVNTIPADN